MFQDQIFPEILKEFVKEENIFLGDATKIEWSDFLKDKKANVTDMIWKMSCITQRRKRKGYPGISKRIDKLENNIQSSPYI